MTWDLEEFRRLCNDHGLSDTRIYLNALAAKHWRAQAFSEKAVNVWKDLFATHDEISTSDEEWSETWFLSESYVEATLQALHSMADILAQIINLTVLGAVYTEDEVSLTKVRNRLQQTNAAPNVTIAVQAFIHSDEFRYTNGFVNTIKHRRLLETEYRIEGGTYIEFKEGMRIKQFEYGGEVFPVKWIDEILDVIIPRVINGINTIGNAINDSLR